MAYTLSSECCDCQEVYNNDLGPCDDCEVGCEVTLSVAVDSNDSEPHNCDGTALVFTLVITIPANETVASGFLDFGGIPNPVNMPSIQGVNSGTYTVTGLRYTLQENTSDTDTVKAVITTSTGTICESAEVTFSTGGTTDINYYTVPIYGNPYSGNSTTSPLIVPDTGATEGEPCGCYPQCFTVNGDLGSSSASIQIIYKETRNSAFVGGNTHSGQYITNKKFSKLRKSIK